jgi:hypothetical protein
MAYSIFNLHKKTTFTALGCTSHGQSVSGWDLNLQDSYIYSAINSDTPQAIDLHFLF